LPYNDRISNMEETKIAYKKKQRSRRLNNILPSAIPFNIFNTEEKKQIGFEQKQQKEYYFDEDEKKLEEIVKMYQTVLGKDEKDKQYVLVILSAIGYSCGKMKNAIVINI
jgi:hypothetical protein